MYKDKMDRPGDKHWAKHYLLDPLTAPEPHQEDGPGTSFINPDPLLRTCTSRRKGNQPAAIAVDTTRRQTPLPTPPTSASPTRVIRPGFDYSKPLPRLPITSITSPIKRKPLPPQSPASSTSRLPPAVSITRSTSSDDAPGLFEHNGPHLSAGPLASHTRSTSIPDAPNGGLRRNQSLSQRFPGDMSHRPLDTLAQHHKTAGRARHLRSPRRVPETDLIDSLDTIGGTYHHGGPYDATLASRNRNKTYAPLDAVHDSNMEALRATPHEHVQDSLQKHMPLQGTSTIPPGSRDLRGKVMDYEEGADLMREPDAQGGAYKRWPGVRYHPDDLKGKGEPSYTYERDLKEKKRLRNSIGGYADFEMQTGANRKENRHMTRQRSFSNAADGRLAPPQHSEGFSNSSDIHRANSTGKRFSDGIKRRLGSFRRKQNAEVSA